MRAGVAIYGERGTTALISNGLTSIRGPATGVVTFNNGVAQLTGKGYPTKHLTMATEACAAQNCPNAKCSVGVVLDIVRNVRCGGIDIWEWPTGVSLTRDENMRSTLRQAASSRTSALAASASTISRHATRASCAARAPSWHAAAQWTSAWTRPRRFTQPSRSGVSQREADLLGQSHIHSGKYAASLFPPLL